MLKKINFKILTATILCSSSLFLAKVNAMQPYNPSDTRNNTLIEQNETEDEYYKEKQKLNEIYEKIINNAENNNILIIYKENQNMFNEKEENENEDNIFEK